MACPFQELRMGKYIKELLEVSLLNMAKAKLIDVVQLQIGQATVCSILYLEKL